MNREIKFRAWDSKNDFMFYHDENGEFERKIDGCRVGSDFNIQELLFNPYECLIRMQYTGLNDINGKEMFEGDIVKCGYGIGKIIFRVGCFMVEWIDDKGSYNEFLFSQKGVYSRDGDDRFEIIGNLFQNPELLQS